MRVIYISRVMKARDLLAACRQYKKVVRRLILVK